MTDAVRFRGLYSSLSPHWRTPSGVYAELDREFEFDFDPCPPKADFDGLMVEWGDRNFVNPPYGRGRTLELWLAKGRREQLVGHLSVFLVPSRTDTKWWHEYAMHADEVRFVRGRLQFYGAGPRNDRGPGTQAPFPSAILVFRP